jgi:hypothetical protein
MQTLHLADPLVDLESVIRTHELNQRFSRLPDYEAENRAPAVTTVQKDLSNGVSIQKKPFFTGEGFMYSTAGGARSECR